MPTSQTPATAPPSNPSLLGTLLKSAAVVAVAGLVGFALWMSDT